MKNYILYLITFTIFLSGCIGDDIILDTVPERIKITNALDSLQVNTTYQFEADFFNNIGQRESRSINWLSSDESVLSIDAQGLGTANAIGAAIVTASITLDDNSSVSDEFMLQVSEEPTVITPPTTERSGQINTTSSYALSGDFILKEDGDQLLLEFADNYQASSSLPGLYVYLTNNLSSTSGAFEIGAVSSFEGAHSYVIDGVGINDYNFLLYFCKPFSVKVGDGEVE